MPKVTFILRSGEKVTAAARPGDSAMWTALRAGIDGIKGECGGGLSCATCHVSVDASWAACLPPPQAAELELLDFTEVPRTAASRLACQITLTNELDGLVLSVP